MPHLCIYKEARIVLQNIDSRQQDTKCGLDMYLNPSSASHQLSSSGNIYLSNKYLLWSWFHYNWAPSSRPIVNILESGRHHLAVFAKQWADLWLSLYDERTDIHFRTLSDVKTSDDKFILLLVGRDQLYLMVKQSFSTSNHQNLDSPDTQIMKLSRVSS